LSAVKLTAKPLNDYSPMSNNLLPPTMDIDLSNQSYLPNKSKEIKLFEIRKEHS
jgi:hypothetical protein